VRVILRVLLEKYRQAGGERRMKCGVQKISSEAGAGARAGARFGEEITATHIISSIGAPETERLIGAPSQTPALAAGRLSFVETISILRDQPAALGGSDTIVFFNDSPRFDYACPAGPVDVRSGVICIPSNFDYGSERTLPEGIFRVTCLARYDRWALLPEDVHQAEKKAWFGAVQRSARRFLPAVSDDALAGATLTTDMFTPRTITKFTGHIGGAIYGAPVKHRQGRTALENVYLRGTDQGFLGIIGAMLSGISMANYHILQKG